MNLSDARWVAGRYPDRGAAAHAFVRVLTCPFDLVIAQLPNAGEVLDIGCGHGVLGMLARRDRPRLHVTGIDIDRPKVLAAQSAGETARWSAADGGAAAILQRSEGWNAITIVDVLYIVGWDHADQLLGAAAAAVAPGGALIVKETGPTPRWKAALSRWQERVATSTIGPTAAAERPCPYPLERGAALLAKRGMTCHLRDVGRGYHVPHRLLVARRPAA